MQKKLSLILSYLLSRQHQAGSISQLYRQSNIPYIFLENLIIISLQNTISLLSII